MKRLRCRLYRFWFEPTQPGPLGFFRVVFGALLLLWGILMRPGLLTWYSEQGMFPLAAMRTYNGSAPLINLLGRVTDTRLIAMFFIVYFVAALLLTIGFCTRGATIITFLCLASLHHRNVPILHGGDSVIRMLCFYLMFAPAGAAYSVDRLLRMRRGKEHADSPNLIEPWALRLIQIQVWIIYVCTLLAKISGTAWQNGTAVHYPIHLTDLKRFPVPFAGENLLAINLLTYGTLAIELSLVLFLWSPRYRGAALAGGIVMHLGIAYALNIPLFSCVMIISYLTFVRNNWLTAFETWLMKVFRKSTVRRRE